MTEAELRYRAALQKLFPVIVELSACAHAVAREASAEDADLDRAFALAEIAESLGLLCTPNAKVLADIVTALVGISTHDDYDESEPADPTAPSGSPTTH